MSDFFEQVKVSANKAKDEAVKIGKQVFDKTNVMMSRTKLNFAINDAENKVKETYAKIGEKIYSEYLSGNTSVEGLEDCFSQIDKLFEEINDLKEKMAELKDSVKCPKCGFYNAQGSEFCSKCGAAFSEEDYAANSENSEADVTYADAVEETPETVKKVITIKAKKPESEE